MKAIECRRAILREMAKGRTCKRSKSGTLLWRDGIRSPSLKNEYTSALFRTGCIEEKDGIIGITVWGTVILEAL